MSSTKNLGGRPRHINSPEEFDRLVDEYIQKCLDDKKPIMWTSMAIHLGFTSRGALDEYANYDGFSHSVKRAKFLVEEAYELRLVEQGRAADMFALKNFKWSDKQTVEHTGDKDKPLVVGWEAPANDDE